MADLVSVHANVVPAGHGSPEQEGVAAKVASPPTERVSEAGLIVTDESAGAIVIIAELRTVCPFKVAFTNRVKVPTALPAVNVTD
jgi:hypothetical protein